MKGINADSLLTVLNKSKNDSSKIKQLLIYAGILRDGNQKEKVLEILFSAKKIADSLNDYKSKFNTLLEISRAHYNLNKKEEAIKYCYEILYLSEEKKDSGLIAESNYQLARLYYYAGDLKKANSFFLKGIEILEKHPDKNENQLSMAYMAVGVTFLDLGNISESKKYNLRSVFLKEKLHLDKWLAFSYINIGELYRKEKNYGESEKYLLKARDLSKKLNQAKEFNDTYIWMGLTYGDKREYSRAINEILTCENYYISNGMLDELNIIYENLAKLYSKNKNPEKESEYLNKYIKNQKEVLNKEKAAQVAEMEAKYHNEKKEQEIAIQASELKLKESKITQQSTQKFALSLGFSLTIVIAIILFRNFKKQKNFAHIIQTQKEVVEQKAAELSARQKEILDSITYAKRLQDAILPSSDLLQKYFPESYVFYKPKDIVAGDFYWLENVDDYLFIAAADCTGHGVPGSLVSVVCSNALNQAVKEFLIIDPGKILDKVRELVIETFEKSQSEVKDGMDISLARFNLKTNEIKWAGANNPLWYYNSNDFTEIKANKQPIGKSDNPKPFTTHEIKINKGDLMYLFTDGFADQFGGPKGKKFKYKQLKEVLISISKKSTNEQKQMLDMNFENWRGNFEQVDDVTIVGIKI